jgi:putative hydrolase of the HAD superfamily
MNLKDQAIKTLFLDVGNTLISMDFDWIGEKLAKIGIPCDPAAIRRAEAAARPALSAKIHENRNNPAFKTRDFLFANLLENLALEVTGEYRFLEEVSRYLIAELFPDGNALRLWSRVMPGVREALTRFRAMGFDLHVISNADGTIERQLVQKNLRPFFGLVIDSHVVQIEKPDPRIFQMALELADCHPRDALYVGDIYHVDVLGAQSAGMQAVLLDPFADWQSAPCEKVPDLLVLAKRFEKP